MTLVWPYTSRTHSCALLLSDPDFRLRYQRGQIKIIFSGAAGRAIARQRVGITEKVVLDLKGGKWIENGEDANGKDRLADVKTPGKSVDGEIGFEDVLQLKVVRQEKEVLVSIEEEDVVKSFDESRRRETMGTPMRITQRSTMQEQVHSSPAFMKRLRASGVEKSSPIIDEMERDDDGEELDSEISRKRRRISYKNITEWKFSQDDNEKADEAVGLGLNLQADVERLAESQVDQEDATMEINNKSPAEETRLEQQSQIASLSSLPPSSSLTLPPLSPSEPQTQIGITAISEKSIEIISRDPSSEEEVTKQQEASGEAHAEVIQHRTEALSIVPTDLVPTMAPPSLPRLEIPQSEAHHVFEQIGPVTPRLIPVSPGSLPLPSPFPRTPLGIISPSIQKSVMITEAEDTQSTKLAARPEYFDRLTTTVDSDVAETHPQDSMRENSRSPVEEAQELVSIPLEEVVRRPSIATAERDAATSPSSGSEADISSEDDDGSDNQIPQSQEHTEDVDDINIIPTGVAETMPVHEAVEGEVMYQEDEDVLAHNQDTDALEHTSDGIGSESLSVRSDDDNEDGLEQNYGPPQMQELEDVIMVDEISSGEDQDGLSSGSAPEAPEEYSQDESAGAQDQDSSQYPSFGLDGAFASKVQDVADVPDESMQVEAVSTENDNQDDDGHLQVENDKSNDNDSVRSSQDEDAAWAALDQAMTTVQEQEANEEKIKPPGLHHLKEIDNTENITNPTIEEGDRAEPEVSQMPMTLLGSPEATNGPDEGASQSNDKLNMKTISQMSFVKTMEAFRESSQSTRGSPSVEEVDLSQVEPDYMNAFLSQKPSQILPPTTIVDSEESPVTTLVAGNSRPISPGNVEIDEAHNVVETVEKGQPSQELGSTNYTQSWDLASEPAMVMGIIGENFDAQATCREAEDEAIDDELLQGSVNEDTEEPVAQADGLDVLLDNNEQPIARDASVQEASTLVDAVTAIADRSQVQSQAEDFKLKESSGGPLSPAFQSSFAASKTSQGQTSNTVAQLAQSLGNGTQLQVGSVNAEELTGDSTTLHSPPAFAQGLQELSRDTKLQTQEQSPVVNENIMTPPAVQPTDSKRRPSRYSRLSLNTEALSDWFTPPKVIDRRKTTTALPTDALETPRPPQLASTTSQTRSVSPPPLKRFSQTPGTATELSYFTPLTNLETQLNNPFSTVDILAVVCDKATDSVRAKSGPRDWFIIFSIIDPDFYDQSKTNAETTPPAVRGTRVEIYRPWKASLPSCSVGDVVLLRGFGVKSRKHIPHLLSGDASAWLVWRYGAESNEGNGTDVTRRSGVKEEIRGPPVEFGEQERGLAAGLREWWEEVQGKSAETSGDHDGKERASGVDDDVLAKL